eukprot:SAG11_NODE_575_length_8420_cov_2.398149_5_plen_157_part_00
MTHLDQNYRSHDGCSSAFRSQAGAFWTREICYSVGVLHSSQLTTLPKLQRDGCVFPRILGPIEDDHDSALGDAALSEHSSNWKEESDTAATLPAADASSSDTTLSDLTDSSDEEFDSAEEEAERSTKTDLFTFSLLPFGNKIAIYGANLVLAPLKR